MIRSLLIFLYLCLLLSISENLYSARPLLIGYWHNWNGKNAPFIPLDLVDSNYDIINVAFAIPNIDNCGELKFRPYKSSRLGFYTSMQALQSKGKKVLISIGGADSNLDLSTEDCKNEFVISIIEIISDYGFDGLDIDLEGSECIKIKGGTILNPSNEQVVNLIKAIKEITRHYESIQHKKMILSITPEAANVLGGQTAYKGLWGAYLPILAALEKEVSMVQVQYYNSGSMYGLDNRIYEQGSADFVVAMTEALIQGFETEGGRFAGLHPSKIAISLPACKAAATGGFVDFSQLETAIHYLRNGGQNPGNYVLLNKHGYSELGGMMTWSINWDIESNKEKNQSFSKSFNNVFQDELAYYNAQDEMSEISLAAITNDLLEIKFTTMPIYYSRIRVYNNSGTNIFESQIYHERSSIDISELESGIYLFDINTKPYKIFVP
jgi:chitinase